jgi:hypothetical protein
MDCCICCLGPFVPVKEVLRRDGLGSRAILFMDGEAEGHSAEWNLSDKPKLVDKKEELHIFHESSFMPVVDFYTLGIGRKLWGRMDAFQYNAANFAGNAPRSIDFVTSDTNSDIYKKKFRGAVKGDCIVLPDIKEDKYRVLQWAAPKPLVGFEKLSDLILECLTNIGTKARHIPTTNVTVPGCQSCNAIMTQRSTTAHFLVRSFISDTPLVPLEAIFSIACTGKPGASFKFAEPAKYSWDPNNKTRDGKNSAWPYPACIAYYVQRCLPAKPVGQTRQIHTDWHDLTVIISVLVLEIACLRYERLYGSTGGKTRNTKPAFRYRGCAEVYLSYIFWLLLRNDNVQGEESGTSGLHCKMEFAVFHRYLFIEIMGPLMLADSDLAGECEIFDMVFGSNDLNADAGEPNGLMPGTDMSSQDAQIAYMCATIANFYTVRLKPIFSRHMAGLEPDKTLLEIPSQEKDRLYIKQILANNALMSTVIFNNILFLLSKTVNFDIDTYIDSVGIHGVLAPWRRMLEITPTRTQRQLDEYMDCVTLMEYKGIQLFMRPDEFQPTISNEAAETIYVMCNALELNSEPSSKEELEQLRIAPKCSPFKAISRLSMVGGVGRPPV